MLIATIKIFFALCHAQLLIFLDTGFLCSYTVDKSTTEKVLSGWSLVTHTHGKPLVTHTLKMNVTAVMAILFRRSDLSG